MPVSVVVGGQYGSEGKGKVAAWLAKEMRAKAVVRCGGSNSGHTVYDEHGRKFVFRQLPTACLQKEVKNILVSGSYIDVDILLREISNAEVLEGNLFIDPYAVIITEEHRKKESNNGLVAGIGSTGSGTGAAVMQRVSRSSDIVFAKDVVALKPFLHDTKDIISELLLNNERIIIEGTQGYGLSLLHSNEYPYVTSRDTTVAGCLAEAGISPSRTRKIIMVCRTYPITHYHPASSRTDRSRRSHLGVR